MTLWSPFGKERNFGPYEKLTSAYVREWHASIARV
jgi:hypothetical protein